MNENLVYPNTFEEALQAGWKVCWSRPLQRVKGDAFEKGKTYIYVTHDKQEFGESPIFVDAPDWLVRLCDEERAVEKTKLQKMAREVFGL